MSKAGNVRPDFQKLASRTAWDDPGDRHTQISKLRKSLDEDVVYLLRAYPSMNQLGGRLKQGSGVTSKGVPHTLGTTYVIRSLFSADRRILSVPSVQLPTTAGAQNFYRRPSSRWRAPRAPDAVQHAGTETETRSRKSQGTETHPATQKTERGGRKANHARSAAQGPGLRLQGVQRTTMPMARANISKKTAAAAAAAANAITTVARAHRTRADQKVDGHAARADPLLAHDPVRAPGHAIGSEVQVEIDP